MVFTSGKKGIKTMKTKSWFIFGCVWLLAMATHAEDKITFLPIKPVPAIEKQSEAEKYKIEHNINEVEATGMIQRMAENIVVVNGRTYQLASNVAFYSAEREPLPRNEIRTGNIVGWQMNAKGEISKLWKLADGPLG